MRLSQKMLERGKFTFVADVKPGMSSVEIGADELALLLEGVDARAARRSPRWSREAPMVTT